MAEPCDCPACEQGLEPFTVAHFRVYCAGMVFDDDELREPEEWQLAYVEDVFAGLREVWLIVPEGNGKTTFLAQIVLYAADHSLSPWIPLGAASREQAEILYSQAAGFIERTDWLKPRFKAFDGYRKIKSLRNGGRGIQVYAADVKTGDGVIPYPFAIIDELHRHDDLRLYSLWKGKLRKRGAQILTISTAGEPETPFENTRDDIRRRATEKQRDGSYLRAYGPGLAMHEYMVQKDEDCADMEAVKAANPLSALTEQSLADEYASPTLDLGNWKRLKCNRATRSAKSAITDLEWEQAEADENEIPPGDRVDVGLDVGWKWDTTFLEPLWCSPDWTPPVKADPERKVKAKPPKGWRLLGAGKVLVPPRDGSMMHPDVIKTAFEELNETNPIMVVVMDMSRAEDIAAWLADELAVEVVDRGQSNQFAVADYDAFMEGLRNGTLKHTGCPDLRQHVLNAIARRLPGGDHRFDRPSSTRQNAKAQDRRVIDGLTAAGMVVEYSNREQTRSESVYEERFLPA